MIVFKKHLKRIIKESFETAEPGMPGEMQSSEHVMMTVLVRKIYDNILDKEFFLKIFHLLKKL